MEKQLLEAIAVLCREKGEAEDSQLALRTGHSLEQIRTAIEKLEEKGLIEVEEFGFSCFAEYTVRSLTEQGIALLDE